MKESDSVGNNSLKTDHQIAPPQVSVVVSIWTLKDQFPEGAESNSVILHKMKM